MNLIDATALLDATHKKYFSDVYKLYEFEDTVPLKDYLDFILHEPVEWMRGFPCKLTSKTSFSKPKTALVKLVKHDSVKAALGEQYAKQVYDAVWQAFKAHGDAIVAKRGASDTGSEGICHVDEDDAPHMMIAEEIESVHSIKLPREAKKDDTNASKKAAIVESALRELVKSMPAEYAGAFKVLLDGLSSF